MGGVLSWFWTPPKRALLLGMQGSGKTTLLYNLKLGAGGAAPIPAPTSANMEPIEFGGVSFEIWEIGGGSKVRPLWPHYYDSMEILIFVVDVADQEGLPEAARLLRMVLADEKLRNAKVLVFANKMDLLENGDIVGELENILELKGEFMKNRRIKIQPCCALTTDGFEDGFTWLVQEDLEKKLLGF